MMYGARLLGGPFDGDVGIIPALPSRLWVYACCNPTHSYRCPGGGTHWSLCFDDLPDGEREAAAYDLDPDGPDGAFYIYVYGELAAHLGPLLMEAEA